MFYFKPESTEECVTYYKITGAKDFHEAQGVVYGVMGCKVSLDNIRGLIVGEQQFQKDMQSYTLGVVAGKYEIKNILEINQKSCGECFYYRIKCDRIGECLLNPPQVFYSYPDDLTISKRPSVYDIDYCRHYAKN
jgi:hypothetical protein